MPKNLNKMSIEGMYPNIVKKKKNPYTISPQLTSYSMVKNLKHFSLRSGVRCLLIFYMKILNKDTDRMKRTCTEWKNASTYYMTDKGLKPSIEKQLIHLNIQKN